MGSSMFARKAAHQVQLLAFAAVVSFMGGCLRDPDVGKITCNTPMGCPVGYTCAASGKCCKSANGITCDGLDAGFSEVQVGFDSSAADGKRSLDVQMTDLSSSALSEAGDRVVVDAQVSPLDMQMADSPNVAFAEAGDGASIDITANAETLGKLDSNTADLTETDIRADVAAGTGGAGGAGGAGGSGGIGGSSDAKPTDATDASDAASTDTSDAPVIPLPVISTFSALASSITAGKSTTLSWTVTGATTVTIDQSVGSVAATGTKVVTPGQNTTYTLTAQNSAGNQVTAQAVVTVVLAPIVTSFKAAASPISPGASTVLTAVFANGTGAIDNSIGAVLSGTGINTGSLSAKTTYTLVVTNSLGDATQAQVTVAVQGFISAGSMSVMRAGHTATLLKNGKVLIAGGYVGTDPIASAELYDSATGFVRTGSMTTTREHHTATLLSNGKVLVTGGTGGTPLSYLSSAELYDPVSGTFSAVPVSMTYARDSHTATELASGKILIAGGIALVGNVSDVELFDPLAGTITLASDPMIDIVAGQTATRLSSGKVLFVGGYNGNVSVSSTEIYEPTSATFSATAGSMVGARAGHTATLLGNATVLIAGGWAYDVVLDYYAISSTAVYNPGTDSFSSGSMTTVRENHTATVLTNGQVLLVGGDDGAVALSSAEVFDPGLGTFSPAGQLSTARYGHTATLLPNGQVLVVGGRSGGVHFASVELYIY